MRLDGGAGGGHSETQPASGIHPVGVVGRGPLNKRVLVPGSRRFLGLSHRE